MEIQEQKTAIVDPLEIAIKNSLDALPTQLSEPFTIFRVPASVRKDKEDQYEPNAVSIGPYHHNTERFRTIQVQKRRYLNDFLARYPNTKLGVYLNEARAMELHVRKCYREQFLEVNNEEFARMLVLDGCFILELAFKLATRDNVVLNLGTLLSDLLLIENQIPLFVIQKIYDLAIATIPVASPDRRDLKQLLAEIPTKILPPKKQLQGFRGEVHHLLHLCYQLFVPCSEPESISNISSRSQQSSPPLTPYLKPNLPDFSSLLRIPCADELLENGTTLIAKSQTQDIFDITYNHYILKIPPFSVDPIRKTLYANMLAFEETVTFGCEKRKVTSLVMLMNCLIKTANDVEILRRAGIISNLLVSEKDHALSFFTDLHKQVSHEPREHHFANIFSNIHQRRAKTYIQKSRPYTRALSSNPWSLITFGFAFFSFVLSFIQAVLAIVHYKKTSSA